MRAEILAVGSELLTPLRSDTNALYLTAKLLEVGVEVGARITVADDSALLESAFRTALSRADIVIATGGLGPTEDDLTREAAAAALGRGLRRDAAILEALKARFAKYLRHMAPVNEKQADVIEGAVVLPNARGTAPGQRLEVDGRMVALLPGPPGELRIGRQLDDPAEGPDRFGPLAEALIDQPQMIVGGHEVGAQAEGGPELLARGVQPPKVDVGPGQILARRRGIGIPGESQGLLIGRNGLLPAPEIRQRDAQPVIGIGKVRGRPDRGLEGFHRQEELPVLVIREPQGVGVGRLRGIEGQRLFEGQLGLLIPSLPEPDQPKLIMGLGLQFHGLAVQFHAPGQRQED